VSGDAIVLRDVSRFYGDVLGVNRVELTIEPGLTGLVGPNGSGKTTLMNLMTGLVRPTRGSMTILGVPPDRPEELFRFVGYCTQYDSFPRGMSGRQLLYSYLLVHGRGRDEAARLTQAALERVGLVESAERKVAGYSKGMRQRIKLAQAICHEPRVLVLDEPLNGLDPMARAEIIALFRELADRGLFVLVSSHILHEVDMISDRVILLNNGYVVAEGDIQGVRNDIREQALQVFVRCDRPALLAARILQEDSVVEVQMHADGRGLLLRTRDADGFYLLVNRIVVEEGLEIEAIGPADDNVQAVYQYLVGGEGVGT
jgi:ABC-2 type transport system ATP-binding protein